MSSLIDLTGRTFGTWTVLRRDGTANGHHRLWVCRCACGAEHRREAGALLAGRSRRCRGCYQRARRERAQGESAMAAERQRKRSREAKRAARSDPILREKEQRRERERDAARRQGLRLPDQRRRNWRAMTPQPIGSAR